MEVRGVEFENQKQSRFENNTFGDENAMRLNRESVSTQPRFVAAPANRSYFEPKDIVAAVVASTMMLGPLFAYAIGWGV